jgi:hypothetical protein
MINDANLNINNDSISLKQLESYLMMRTSLDVEAGLCDPLSKKLEAIFVTKSSIIFKSDSPM